MVEKKKVTLEIVRTLYEFLTVASKTKANDLIYLTLHIECYTRSLQNLQNSHWSYLSLKLECASSFSHGYHERCSIYKPPKSLNTERWLEAPMRYFMPLNPLILKISYAQNGPLTGKTVKASYIDVPLLI